MSDSKNMIPITDLYALIVRMSGILIARKEQVAWSQLKPVAFFQANFADCLAFALSVGLNHVATWPMLVWLSHKDIHVLLVNSSEVIHSPWITQLTEILIYTEKTSHLPVPMVLSSSSFTVDVVTPYNLHKEKHIFLAHILKILHCRGLLAIHINLT